MFDNVQGYRQRKWKTVLFYFLNLCTFGALWILTQWSPWLWSRIRVSRCDVLFADFFLIPEEGGSHAIVESVRNQIGGYQGIGFIYKYQRYLYEDGHFHLVKFQLGKNCEAHNINVYPSQESLAKAKLKFGPNSTELDKKPILVLLIDELMHPLFVFQLFQIFLWIYESYISYAIILLIVSIVSMVDTVYEFNKSYRKLQRMSRFQQPVLVQRFGRIERIDSIDLVPGDIIMLEQNQIIPCDAILIQGKCVVSEYSQNGDQAPKPKYPLQNNQESFNSYLCQSSILYHNTLNLKSYRQCLAFVLHTGFNTQRGKLIREINVIPDYSFDFYQDSLRYLKYLSIIALIGYLIALPFKIKFIQRYSDIVSYTDLVTDVLDLVAVCVPPTLPTTLQIGLNFALKRLKRKEIYCIEPAKINLAGLVQIVCFDKTGTLTEDQLSIQRVILAEKSKFQAPCAVEELQAEQKASLSCCTNLYKNEQGEFIGDQLDKAIFSSCEAVRENNDTITVANASYEILTIYELEQDIMSVIACTQDERKVFAKGSPERIKEVCCSDSIPEEFDQILGYYAINGYQVIATAQKALSGRQLQERAICEQNLNFTGFLVVENRIKQLSEAVVAQLNHANIEVLLVTGDNILTSVRVARQCQIIKQDQKLIYGDLGENNQIIWRDFDIQFQKMNSQINNRARDLCNYDQDSSFYRGSNHMPHSNINLEAKSQTQLDANHQFSETPEQNALIEYNKARAVTGRLLKHLIENSQHSEHPEEWEEIIKSVKVFAKMKRDHKKSLINYFQEKQAVVGFCGVCGNDALAMKSADIGISLTNLQVSMAAPFTSAKNDVATVPLILIEGRGALITSFQSFEYMTLCSLVQFISCTLLYFQYSYMSNAQYLVIDLFVVLPLSILMNYTGNSNRLTKELPEKSLISPEILGTVIGQALVQLVFQVIVYARLINQDWYLEPVELSGKQYGDQGFIQSFEATSLFLISNFQYSAISVALSYDLRFKQPIYKNSALLAYLVILSAFGVYLLLFTHRDDTDDDMLDLTFKVSFGNKKHEMPESWLYFLLLIVALNSSATFVYQYFVLPALVKLIKTSKVASC